MAEKKIMMVGPWNLYALDSKDRFPSFDPAVQAKREGTTFYGDFKVAETFLDTEPSSLKDTWKSAWNEWKNTPKYCVELALVLNHLCWEHYDEGKADLSEWYANKFHYVQNRIYAAGTEEEPLPEGCRPFTQEEQHFAFEVLD